MRFCFRCWMAFRSYPPLASALTTSWISVFYDYSQYYFITHTYAARYLFEVYIGKPWSTIQVVIPTNFVDEFSWFMRIVTLSGKPNTIAAIKQAISVIDGIFPIFTLEAFLSKHIGVSFRSISVMTLSVAWPYFYLRTAKSIIMNRSTLSKDTSCQISCGNVPSCPLVISILSLGAVLCI